MVKKELQSLDTSKSTGPDHIHPRLLKELAEHISNPITQLLNKTIKNQVIPTDWKMAFISPIFKKGSRNIASNYRPISLTCILCKLMEKFIRAKIMEHLQNENLLSTKQFGFINGRSTTIQLLNYLDECADIIAQGGVVDTIYLDFAKAFDTVPHQRLIGKLKSYGISGCILVWIEQFLIGRSQVVLVNGTQSLPTSVLSGIPQGTVLGPVLFIIYINDILTNVDSKGYLFADDTKIFRQITTVEDSVALQRDIKSLEDWTKHWLLSFNQDKCHVLTLGKFENITHTHRYKLFGKEIDHVFEEKDLGVTFDSNMSFEEHISGKIKKANSIVGLIRRSFSFLDCSSFKKIYIAYVRPHLEYAQCIWSPHLTKLIDAIENVQVRATKLVDGLSKYEYSERLKKMNLPTLLYRRKRGDLIEMFQHFKKYNANIISKSFRPRERCSRKHDFQLHQLKASDGKRGTQTNSFYFRVAKEWNNLPSHIVNAENTNTFKNRLDEHWKDLPIKFDHKAIVFESD